MEMEAIQMRKCKLTTHLPNEVGQYYCAGHSVVNYLNGYASSLIGHKGRAGVEVIATFLPEMVWRACITVMERPASSDPSDTGPIAALNVAIPKELAC